MVRDRVITTPSSRAFVPPWTSYTHDTTLRLTLSDQSPHNAAGTLGPINREDPVEIIPDEKVRDRLC